MLTAEELVSKVNLPFVSFENLQNYALCYIQSLGQDRESISNPSTSLGAAKVRDILIKSGLSNQVLARVWNAVCFTSNVSLNFAEFVLAMWICQSIIQTGNINFIVPDEYKRAVISSSSNLKLSTNTSNNVGIPNLSPTIPLQSTGESFQQNTSYLQPQYSGQFNQILPLTDQISGQNVSNFDAFSQNSRLSQASINLNQSQFPNQYSNLSLQQSINPLSNQLSGSYNSLPPTQPYGTTPNIGLISQNPSSYNVGSGIPNSFSQSSGIAESQFATNSNSVVNINSNREHKWAVSPEEKAQYDSIFKIWDPQNTGFITGDRALTIFNQSGLSSDILAHIWELSDISKLGKLNAQEFAVAMHLVYSKLNGKDLPKTLPDDLIPPSTRDLNSLTNLMKSQLINNIVNNNTGGKKPEPSKELRSDPLFTSIFGQNVSTKSNLSPAEKQKQEAEQKKILLEQVDKVKRKILDYKSVAYNSTKQVPKLQTDIAVNEDKLRKLLRELQPKFKELTGLIDIVSKTSNNTSNNSSNIEQSIIDLHSKIETSKIEASRTINDLLVKLDILKSTEMQSFTSKKSEIESKGGVSSFPTAPSSTNPFLTQSVAAAPADDKQSKAAQLLAARMAALGINTPPPTSTSPSSSIPSIGSPTAPIGQTKDLTEISILHERKLKQIEESSSRLRKLREEIDGFKILDISNIKLDTGLIKSSSSSSYTSENVLYAGLNTESKKKYVDGIGLKGQASKRLFQDVYNKKPIESSSQDFQMGVDNNAAISSTPLIRFDVANINKFIFKVDFISWVNTYPNGDELNIDIKENIIVESIDIFLINSYSEPIINELPRHNTVVSSSPTKDYSPSLPIYNSNGLLENPRILVHSSDFGVNRATTISDSPVNSKLIESSSNEQLPVNDIDNTTSKAENPIIAMLKANRDSSTLNNNNNDSNQVKTESSKPIPTIPSTSSKPVSVLKSRYEAEKNNLSIEKVNPRPSSVGTSPVKDIRNVWESQAHINKEEHLTLSTKLNDNHSPAFKRDVSPSLRNKVSIYNSLDEKAKLEEEKLRLRSRSSSPTHNHVHNYPTHLSNILSSPSSSDTRGRTLNTDLKVSTKGSVSSLKDKLNKLDEMAITSSINANSKSSTRGISNRETPKILTKWESFSQKQDNSNALKLNAKELEDAVWNIGHTSDNESPDFRETPESDGNANIFDEGATIIEDNSFDLIDDTSIQYEMIVLWDFKASRLDELEVFAGDRVFVVSRPDPNWWHVKLIERDGVRRDDGAEGVVPAAFLQPAINEEEDYEEEEAYYDSNAVNSNGVLNMENPFSSPWDKKNIFDDDEAITDDESNISHTSTLSKSINNGSSRSRSNSPVKHSAHSYTSSTNSSVSARPPIPYRSLTRKGSLDVVPERSKPSAERTQKPTIYKNNELSNVEKGHTKSLKDLFESKNFVPFNPSPSSTPKLRNSERFDSEDSNMETIPSLTRKISAVKVIPTNNGLLNSISSIPIRVSTIKSTQTKGSDAERSRKSSVKSGNKSISRKVTVISVNSIPNTVSSVDGNANDENIRGPVIRGWMSKVDPLILSRISDTERKRQEAIFELIMTESSYVHDLQMIIVEYVGPMSGLVTPKQLRQIFANIDHIYMMNSNLLQDLEKLQTESDYMVNGVGEIFIKHVHIFKKAYGEYCNNFGKSDKKLQKLRKENKKLGIFLKEQMLNNPKSRHLDINAYLLLPMKRITSYGLMLKHILKYTLETHDDYLSISEAANAAHDAAQMVNASMLAPSRKR